MPGILNVLQGRTSGGGTETLVDRTTGTNIGNMTSNGGLAAAFDGTTSQTHVSCAAYISGPTGYVGKAYGSGKRISKIVFYPSSNFGYWYLESGGTGDCKLYAKNGSPSSGTDGTLLGSLTGQTDTTTGPFTVTSGDTSTSYTNVWLYIDATAATSAGFVYCAELSIYELV